MSNNHDTKLYILGIDPKTFDIRTVTITHSGYISITSESNPIGQQEYIGNADPETEASIRYNLLHPFSVSPMMLDAVSTKQLRKELQDKADSMKAALVQKQSKP